MNINGLLSASPAAHVAAALDGHKSGKKQWLCCCPAHPDKTPSLSLADGRDGTLLVYCFAGCAAPDILRELRSQGLLDDREDQPESRPTRRVTPPAKDPGKIDWLLSKCLPIRGTLAESYLRARGLDLPVSGDALKYLPPSRPPYIWPCLLAVISDFVTAATINLQLTRLALDGP